MLLIMGLSALAGVPGLGAATFMNKSAMTRTSEAIAVIEMEEPEKVPGPDPFAGPRKEDHYRQFARVKVIKALKGILPETLVIHGDGYFICAQCPLKKGRYLAFLKKDGALWTGTNWHLSLRPATNGMVEWWEGEYPLKMAPKPEQEVINEVKELLQRDSGALE